MLSTLPPTIVPIYYLFIIHSATSCLVECVNHPIVHNTAIFAGSRTSAGSRAQKKNNAQLLSQMLHA